MIGTARRRFATVPPRWRTVDGHDRDRRAERGFRPRKASHNIVAGLGTGVLKIVQEWASPGDVLMRRAGVRGDRPGRRLTPAISPRTARRAAGWVDARGRGGRAASARLPERPERDRAAAGRDGGRNQWRRDGEFNCSNRRRCMLSTLRAPALTTCSSRTRRRWTTGREAGPYADSRAAHRRAAAGAAGRGRNRRARSQALETGALSYGRC